MRVSFASYILALLILYPLSSRAQPIESVDRVMRCGYLVAKADTIMISEPDLTTQIVSQKIKLYNTRCHFSRMIDLEQHLSANKDLDGRKVVDDEAGIWFCLESKTGRRYLYLMFTCLNDDTTSCKYNSERGQLYDDMGQNLNIDKIGEMRSVALWKRLGLSSEQLDGRYITSDHKIFFPK